MKSQTEKIRDELRKYRTNIGFIQKVDCTSDENSSLKKMIKDGTPLPADIEQYVGSSNEPTGYFYRLFETDLNDKELSEYVAFKQLDMLKTIMNCAVFFAIIAGISLFAGVIALINTFYVLT